MVQSAWVPNLMVLDSSRNAGCWEFIPVMSPGAWVTADAGVVGEAAKENVTVPGAPPHPATKTANPNPIEMIVRTPMGPS